MKSFWAALVCISLLTLTAGAPPSLAADPNGPILELPSNGSNLFEGPCGIGIDSDGNLYVGDYYHDAVKIFNSGGAPLASLPKADPDGGPCGVATGSADRLYVNDYHRDVVEYTPLVPLFTDPFPYGKDSEAVATLLDAATPTGVAVGPSGNVYVDDRKYVAVYEPSGVPILHVGEGSIEDGYGVAVSTHAGTAGYVYVADAGDDTVKVFDPATDVEHPLRVIAGVEGDPFVSLRDSALAVSRQSGLVYVADDLQPFYFERPEAAIYAFAPDGSYAGRLEYNVFDARPPGLAVDNSERPSGGRVYVTSGNSERAIVFGYPAGALTKAGRPADEAAVGAAAGFVAPEFGVGPTGSAAAPPLSSAPAGASKLSRGVKLRAKHRRIKRHRRRRRRASRLRSLHAVSALRPAAGAFSSSGSRSGGSAHG